MTKVQEIPKRCDVLVIGGGPAGSTAAGLLAKEGFEVVLVDKARFPRNTIGESVVPQFWRLADLLGVSEKIDKEFIKKSGGITVWDGKVSFLKFKDFGYDRSGLHVERDVFDELLLRHSADLGVKVFENVIVRNVDLSQPGRPTVTYDDRRGGGEQAGTIEAKYLVDASGYSALLAKQFDSRKFLQSDRKFMSVWGYFESSRFYDQDGHSHPNEDLATVRPATLQVKYEDGWAWHIIMRRSTSVGFAMYSDRMRGMDPEVREKFFLESVQRTPHMSELLRGARWIPGSLHYRPDYSYYSEKVTGDDFVCVGDAAAFVDPVFSQGILGCMFHASAAAWSVTGALRTPARKQDYMEMFRRRILGFYSAARLIALGHFGAEGVDLGLAKEFAKGLPARELAILYTAAWATDRHANFIRLAEACGLSSAALAPKNTLLPGLA
ncbi:tryptophan 7-halogenase [Myxococcota bacterium]|nr:tryptophan 7-halogenase [Myxococcota bacterium]